MHQMFSLKFKEGTTVQNCIYKKMYRISLGTLKYGNYFCLMKLGITHT